MVTTLHPLYEIRSRQWEIVRDCIEGEDAIKLKGPKYLPMASGSSPEQYEAYKMRARWNNYTSQNLTGLHGLIFRRNPTLHARKTDLQNSKLLENIDRKGTDLYQFLSDTVYDCIQTSWGGYLVDMPKTNGNLDGETAEKQGIRPYLRYYPAESIINWGYQVINGVEQLAFVVLKEEVEDFSGDEFSHTPSTQYRVLDARGGYYRQRLFTEIKDKEWEQHHKESNYKKRFDEELILVNIDGFVPTEIPFVLLPGDKPEKPMLYDLAMCNIGHYQKSADYENGVHLTTIPTGYVTGHRNSEGPDGEKEVVHLGGDSFLMFEEADAKVGTLVFSGAGLTHSETAINQALTDMAVLGSRLLVTEKGTSESADSAKIHRAGENARLATFAKNVSERITKAVKIMCQWAHLDDDVTIELCTDYDTLAFDANALNAIANLSEAGKMPLPAVYYNLKNGEYLPPEMTLESFATMLEMQNAGYTALEIAEAYRTIQSGESFKVVQKNQAYDNEPPEETEENSVTNEEPADVEK